LPFVHRRSCELKRSADIGQRQLRILCRNLLSIEPFGNKTDDRRNWYTGRAGFGTLFRAAATLWTASTSVSGPARWSRCCGRNGAGKSALLRVPGTTVLPDEGDAHVAGHDVVDAAREVRRRTGLVLGEQSGEGVAGCGLDSALGVKPAAGPVS